jgi:hypothetical protein
MEVSNLLTVCISAFIAVFFVLTFLAISMRLIILVFPAKQEEDSALIAAITSTFSSIYPKSKITKIEEQK